MTLICFLAEDYMRKSAPAAEQPDTLRQICTRGPASLPYSIKEPVRVYGFDGRMKQN